jgi:hypothetical protein
MKYLHNTADFKITYGSNDRSNFFTAYVDVDFAMDLDDRKSRSNFLLMLNGGPIAWGSKKQSTTASSTTEAEYYADQKGAREIRWMRQLLGNLGYPQTTLIVMYSDNQAATGIRLVRNPEFHQLTKHIDVKYHVICEYCQRGDLTIIYVTTDNNLVDVFTKPLARDRFQRLRSLMSMSG